MTFQEALEWLLKNPGRKVYAGSYVNQDISSLTYWLFKQSNETNKIMTELTWYKQPS
jgi:hypothetical protein